MKTGKATEQTSSIAENKKEMSEELPRHRSLWLKPSLFFVASAFRPVWPGRCTLAQAVSVQAVSQFIIAPWDSRCLFVSFDFV